MKSVVYFVYDIPGRQMLESICSVAIRTGWIFTYKVLICYLYSSDIFVLLTHVALYCILYVSIDNPC